MGCPPAGILLRLLQLLHRYAEGPGDPLEDRPRWRALLAGFKDGDVAQGDRGAIGERLLREPLGLAQLADEFAHLLVRHAPRLLPRNGSATYGCRQVLAPALGWARCQAWSRSSTSSPRAAKMVSIPTPKVSVARAPVQLSSPSAESR